MTQNKNRPENMYKPKALIYLTRLTREKKRSRIRPLPAYEEASRRFLPESKEVIVVIRKTEPLKVPLPHHLTRFLKECVFKHRLAENDLKFEIAFVAYEYVNIVLRLLGLDHLTIIYHEPREFEVKKEKLAITPQYSVDKIIIDASDFIVYPFKKPSSNIRFHGEFVDVRDEIDYETFSGAYFTIDLYQLMKEFNMKWDVGIRY